MTGIEAITAQNGWAMAITGAIIVILGLTILSFIISKLHKIIAMFEGKESPHVFPEKKSSAEISGAEAELLKDPSTAARIYKAIAVDLGDKFELAELYQALKDEGGIHPHITIRTLRDSGELVPAGDGVFSWKNS